jgi:hypothetical protein
MYGGRKKKRAKAAYTKEHEWENSRLPLPCYSSCKHYEEDDAFLYSFIYIPSIFMFLVSISEMYNSHRLAVHSTVDETKMMHRSSSRVTKCKLTLALP